MKRAGLNPALCSFPGHYVHEHPPLVWGLFLDLRQSFFTDPLGDRGIYEGPFGVPRFDDCLLYSFTKLSSLSTHKLEAITVYLLPRCLLFWEVPIFRWVLFIPLIKAITPVSEAPFIQGV